MSRARKILGMGSLKKSAGQHSDPQINRLIDDVYKELNKMNAAVNLKAGAYSSSHSEGGSGDIRLFKGTGYDGSTGYFIQGKFTDGWGTARLALETRNPDSTEVANQNVGGSTAPYSIQNIDVTYQLLSNNGSVGFGPGQLAKGYVSGESIMDHQKDGLDDRVERNNIHFELSVSGGDGGADGNITPATLNSFGTGSVAARSDHTHKIVLPTTSTPTEPVTFLASGDPQGVGSYFARSDHSHTLNCTLKYTYKDGSANTVFEIDPSSNTIDIGSGVDTATTIYGGITQTGDIGLTGDITQTGNIILTGNFTQTGDFDLTGDAAIDGALTVTFAEATPTLTVAGDTTLGSEDDTDTVQIWGHTTLGDSDSAVNLYIHSGNVGIGTIAPAHTLEVKGPIGTLARFYNDSNGSQGQIEIGTMDIYVDNDTMQFRQADDTVIMEIQSDGNVGIGTTAPTDLLEIQGAESETYQYPLVLRNPYNNDTNLDYGVGIKFKLDDNAETKWGAIAYEANSAWGNSGDLQFYVDGNTNSSPVMTMQNGGNVGIGNINPAYRLDIEGNVRLRDDDQMYFRDTECIIYSSEAQQLDINANAKFTTTAPTIELISNDVYFGDNTDTDIVLTFNANTADGKITWREDEDEFKFNDDIKMAGAERVKFYDDSQYMYGAANNLYIYSSGGSGALLLNATAQIDLTTAYIDLNASGNMDLYAGAQLNLNSNVNTYLNTTNIYSTATVGSFSWATGTLTGTDLYLTYPDIWASADMEIGNDLQVGGSGNGRINIGTIGTLNGESTSKFDIHSVGCIEYTADKDNNNPAQYDYHAFITGLTETMRIAGNKVGIGTAAPQYTLEVSSGTTDEIARFASTDDHGIISVGDDNDMTYIGYKHSDARMSLGFDNSLGTDNLTIKSDGKVGIGTVTPREGLDLFGDLKFGVPTTETFEIKTMEDSSTSDSYRNLGIISNNFSIATATGDEGGSSLIRLFIEHTTGQVGIGTETPGTLLDIGDGLDIVPRLRLNKGTSDSSYIRFAANAVKYWDLKHETNESLTLVGYAEDHDFAIQVHNASETTEIFRLDASEKQVIFENGNSTDVGFLGINTADPQAYLHIFNDVGSSSVINTSTVADGYVSYDLLLTDAGHGWRMLADTSDSFIIGYDKTLYGATDDIAVINSVQNVMELTDIDVLFSTTRTADFDEPVFRIENSANYTQDPGYPTQGTFFELKSTDTDATGGDKTHFTRFGTYLNEEVYQVTTWGWYGPSTGSIAKNMNMVMNGVTAPHLCFGHDLGAGHGHLNFRYDLGETITTNTDDDNDVGLIEIGAGGAIGDDRGATIQLYGNEHANTGGLRLTAGRVAGSTIALVVDSDPIVELLYDTTLQITSSLTTMSEALEMTADKKIYFQDEDTYIKGTTYALTIDGDSVLSMIATGFTQTTAPINRFVNQDIENNDAKITMEFHGRDHSTEEGVFEWDDQCDNIPSFVYKDNIRMYTNNQITFRQDSVSIHSPSPNDLIIKCVDPDVAPGSPALGELDILVDVFDIFAATEITCNQWITFDSPSVGIEWGDSSAIYAGNYKNRSSHNFDSQIHIYAHAGSGAHGNGHWNVHEQYADGPNTGTKKNTYGISINTAQGIYDSNYTGHAYTAGYGDYLGNYSVITDHHRYTIPGHNE